MGQTEQQLKRRQYLEAMGIQTWQLRQPQSQSHPETEHESVGEVARSVVEPDKGQSLSVTVPEWATIETAVKSCSRCELHKKRTQSVLGVGNRNADWMIIGEAPGADEDKQGEPFVGRAGKLLDQMLLAIGLKRESVYITNIVKCRPPNNRDPKPEEAASCESYLKQQISLIQPKIIFALGRVAAHNLLKTDQRVGAMRGKRFEYTDSGIPVIVSYHPAYLLRSPAEKRKAWEDLLLARRLVSESI